MKRSARYLLADVVVIGAIAHFVYWWGNGTLLASVSDFRNWAATNAFRFQDSVTQFRITTNPFQGLGTVDTPHLLFLNLPAVLASIPDGQLSEVVFGGVSVMVIHVGFFLLSKAFIPSLHQARVVGALGAFLMFFPSPIMMGRVMISMDGMTQVLASFCFLIACLMFFKGQSIAIPNLYLKAMILAGLVASLASIGFVYQIVFMFPLLIGALVPTLLHIRAFPRGRRTAVALVAPAGLVALVGLMASVWFITSSASGSFDDSIVFQESAEFNFWFPTEYGDPLELFPFLFFGLTSICGFHLVRNKQNLQLRVVGWVGLVQQTFLFLYGNLYNALLAMDLEVLPRPFYVGTFVVPFLLLTIITSFFTAVGSFVPARFLTKKIFSVLSVVAVPTAMVAWVILWSVDNSDLRSRESEYPPPRSPIVQDLLDDLEVPPGGIFKGRAMLIQGESSDNPLRDGGGIRPGAALDSLHNVLLNERIPTLSSYGYFQRSGTLDFYSKYFSSGEGFARNWLVGTRLDRKMAELSGVRAAVLSGTTNTEGGLVRLTKYQSTDYKGQVFSVFLLPHTNVGNYSPTRVKVVNGQTGQIEALSSPDFDPRRDVIAEKELGELVPAESTVLRIVGSSLHVTARSSASSLIVLPFEFSSCARFKNPDVEASLLRVNGIFLGVRFSGSIDENIDLDASALFASCIRR